MTTLQRAVLDTTTRVEDLLDQLTTTHRVQVHDGGRILGWRTEPALLEQLRRAKTTATTYGSGPGSSQRHSRATINTSAVALYDAIETRVRSWARHAGYTPQTGSWPLPEAVLRWWWAVKKHDPHADRYQAPLQAWATAITNLLDPPHRFDIDSPCPVCSAHILEVVDPDDETLTVQIRALAGLERDPDIYRVTCRSCSTEWEGLDAASELADEIASNALLDRITTRWAVTLRVWDEQQYEAIRARNA